MRASLRERAVSSGVHCSQQPSPFQWRAAIRATPEPPGLGQIKSSWETFNEQTDWSSALTGIDCVVHLAARVHVMSPTAQDRTEFERINVSAPSDWRSKRLTHGVKRFVYLSSIKVNGEHTGGAHSAR